MPRATPCIIYFGHNNQRSRFLCFFMTEKGVLGISSFDGEKDSDYYFRFEDCQITMLYAVLGCENTRDGLVEGFTKLATECENLAELGDSLRKKGAVYDIYSCSENIYLGSVRVGDTSLEKDEPDTNTADDYVSPSEKPVEGTKDIADQRAKVTTTSIPMDDRPNESTQNPGIETDDTKLDYESHTKPPRDIVPIGKVRYVGKDFGYSLINGHVYDCIGVAYNMLSIVDEECIGDPQWGAYAYSASSPGSMVVGDDRVGRWEIVEDPQNRIRELFDHLGIPIHTGPSPEARNNQIEQNEQVDSGANQRTCCLFSYGSADEAMKSSSLEIVEDFGGAGEGYTWEVGRWALHRCTDCGAYFINYAMKFLAMSSDQDEIRYRYLFPVTERGEALKYRGKAMSVSELKELYTGRDTWFIWFDGSSWCWNKQ